MNRIFLYGIVVAASIFIVGCAREQSDLPSGFIFEAPPTPSNLKLEPAVRSCKVSWSYPHDALALVSEFRVYRYYVDYGQIYLVGTPQDTFFVDSLLVGNLYYCYGVSAVDSSGFEGWRAGPECIFVPDELR